MNSMVIEDSADTLRRLALKVRKDLVRLYPPVRWDRKNRGLFSLENGNGDYRFFDEEFTGACGVASYMLQLLARRHDIELQLTGTDYHFWCQLPAQRHDSGFGRVVDATFSQFDEEVPVYIGKPLEEPHETFEEIAFGGDAKTLLRKYPDVQNPFSKYHAPVIQKWLRSL